MIQTAHNPEARAAAAGRVPLDRSLLPDAKHGRKIYNPERRANGWLPVDGPHLRALRSNYPTNRTGCTGISYGVNRHPRKDGSFRVRRYFFVQVGRDSRRFCLDTLGKEEAWRRALKCRAAYERQVMETNRQILAAREKNEHA